MYRNLHCQGGDNYSEQQSSGGGIRRPGGPVPANLNPLLIMSAENLHEVFIEELKDIYNAEQQLVKALPKMAKAATSESLEGAITEHLEQTKEQVARLEEIFRSLDLTARGKHCLAMGGLIEEGKEVIEDDLEDMVRDAALIGAAQKVEHYEIASYGTLIAHARLLGYDKAVTLLQQTLEEEKQTDQNLTELAESEVNLDAEEEDDEEE